MGTDKLRASGWRITLFAIGFALLALWIFWWTVSFAKNSLAMGKVTWVPTWLFLGLDFLHNYLAVHHLLNGGNPYFQFFGDDRGKYGYPPIVLGLFLWSAFFPLRMQYAAIIVWTLIVAALVALGVRLALKTRGILKLWNIPWPLALAVVLFSTPVVFAMERGNCDVIVLLMIVLAAVAIGRKTLACDILAGVCLAVGMWTKIYPGLIVLATPALGRWRVFVFAVVAGLVIALAPLPATISFFKTAGASEGYRTKFLTSAVQGSRDPGEAASGVQSYPPLEMVSHSLPIYWQTFWTSIGLPRVGLIPGMIGSAIVLGPALLWVFLRIRAMPDPTRLAYPYFLFVAMVGTFWMPVSYDYNLIYLPLLALAVWDIRDGPLVHALMAAVLIYWQPFKVPISKEWLLLFKLMALYALAWCLIHRAKDDFKSADAGV